MAIRKVKKAPKKSSKKSVDGKTGFIALVKHWSGYGRNRKSSWQICGTDIHATAKKARDCGCASYDSENVGVLEVVIVAQHNAETAFVKQDKVLIEFNDK